MSDLAEKLLDLTATIVSAHVGHNSSQADALPELIRSIYSTLRKLEAGGAKAETAPLVPAVPIKKSIFADHIICLEDGRKLKTLKRHVMTSFGLTPDAYRAKWNLPGDYPMVAPNYTKLRRGLAMRIGLGKMRTVEAAVPAPATPAKKTRAPRKPD